MIRSMFLAATLAALSATASGKSFYNDFDSENGGVSAPNYTGFAEINVAGQVDLIANGDFGITCFGGSLGCVDLDGSPGPGTLSATQMREAFPLYSVVLTFELSGNQRTPGSSDEVLFGISRDGVPVDERWIVVDWDSPFQEYLLQVDFLVVAAEWTGYVGTTSGDGFGPIIDNFNFGVTDGFITPAPGTLVLLGLGALCLGRMRRR